MPSDDSAYKKLFSSKEVVRDFVLAFLPEVRDMDVDFDTLCRQPTEFVSDRGRQSLSDIVWRVGTRHAGRHIYFLIEFQTSVKKHMALRMMSYEGSLLQDIAKSLGEPARHTLPPVLPIVLYNGQRPWRAPTDTARLVNALPGPLSALQPQVRYLLIDEARSKGLNDDHNLIAVLFKMAHAGSPQAFAQGLEKLKKLVQNNAELTHSVLFWLNVMLRKRGILGSVDENQLEGDWTMGYKWGIELWMENKQVEWLQEGIEQGFEQGIERGKGHGACLILQKQLAKRFGAIPHERLELIHRSHTDQLEIWAERVLTAHTIEEVFAPDGQLA